MGDLIDVLKKIHSSETHIPEDIKIYSNYSEKINSRYLSNIDLYEKIDRSRDFYEEISKRLNLYEIERRGKCGIIHGDPVFTNIFLTERSLKLIDPRGKNGESLSIYGDINYDFSKIFQSIMGYDHILSGVEINYNYMNRMMDSFSRNFSKEEFENIKTITASLFFSLIPLHEISMNRFNKYFNTIEKLIS